MKSHDLAKKLLQMENKNVTASIDLSTCDEDAFKRAFGFDVYEIIDDGSKEITICFDNGVEDNF